MQPRAFAIETEGLSKHGNGVVQASNGSIAEAFWVASVPGEIVNCL